MDGPLATPGELFDPRSMAELRSVFAGDAVFPAGRFASPPWLEVGRGVTAACYRNGMYRSAKYHVTQTGGGGGGGGRCSFCSSSTVSTYVQQGMQSGVQVRCCMQPSSRNATIRHWPPALFGSAAAAPGAAGRPSRPPWDAQVLAACGMKREMDAATLERRAAAIADKWAGAPDSHEPAAAAAAALKAGAALAAHFAKAAEALQEPGLFARLAGVASLPADQVCASPCCPRYQGE